MNLNSWLCKTLDKDKKGYVTIGDISVYILDFVITISTISMVFFLVSILLLAYPQGLITIDYPASLYDIVYVSLVSWILPLKIVAASVIIVFFIYIITQIKIAKCPLKEIKTEEEKK